MESAVSKSRNRLKIAYLSQRVDNITGIGRVVSALAGEMSRRGHEVHCVSQSCDNDFSRWHRVVRSHATNALDKALYRVHEPLVTRRLRCDVKHSMGVGRAADVVSAGSCHMAAVELARAAKPTRLRNRNWGFFDRLSLQDERRLMLSDSTRTIVAVSRLVRDQILKYYPIEPGKVVVIPNGVETALYASVRDPDTRRGLREALHIHEADTVLLFVGNEFDRKGLQTIIEALPLLRIHPVILLVAGDDDPTPYRSLAEKLNVSSKVRFLGRVNDVRRLFGASDLFVLPTMYEPFGLVIAEAMAAGVPVIVSRRVGAVEDMIDGQHGLFIDDPHSASELASLIDRMVDNSELRLRCAENGLNAIKKYDWTNIADLFEELYYA